MIIIIVDYGGEVELFCVFNLKFCVVHLYRYLITCGSDGDVRVYDGFDDDDPLSFTAGEIITVVKFKVSFCVN